MPEAIAKMAIGKASASKKKRAIPVKAIRHRESGAISAKPLCANSLMNRLSPLVSTSAAIILWFCGCGVAFAQFSLPAQTEIAGRWTAEKGQLVLDVSKCGEGWCGVKVEGGACGIIALRLGTGRKSEWAVLYDGRLQLAPESAAYVVQADLLPRLEDGQLRLNILGSFGPASIFTRVYPFHQLFVRSDKADCLADQKTS